MGIGGRREVEMEVPPVVEEFQSRILGKLSYPEGGTHGR